MIVVLIKKVTKSISKLCSCVIEFLFLCCYIVGWLVSEIVHIRMKLDLNFIGVKNALFFALYRISIVTVKKKRCTLLLLLFVLSPAYLQLFK